MSVAGRSAARNGLIRDRSTAIPNVGEAGSARAQAARNETGRRTDAAGATAFAARFHDPDVVPIGM